MSLALWCLAVAGSALVLTQSSLTASARAWLLKQPFPLGTVGKLVSCPMCSGFWLGMAWAWYLINRGGLPSLVGAAWAYGFAGSIVSALSVAAWLALSEAQAVSYLWRSRNQKGE